MQTKEKIILLIGGLIFNSIGIYSIIDELAHPPIYRASIIFSVIFILIGIFILSPLFFYTQFEKLEQNKRAKAIFIYIGKSILTIGAILISIIFFALPFQEPDNIQQSDLQIIRVTAKAAPHYHRGSKSSSYMNFFTNEFGKISFEPQYEKYVHYNTNFETNVLKNDTVFVGITKADYKAYIENYKNFQQNYKKKYKSITAYLIQKNNSVYYNTQIHNHLYKEDKKVGKYLSLLGFLGLFSIISIWFMSFIKLFKKIKAYRIVIFLIKMRRSRIL